MEGKQLAGSDDEWECLFGVWRRDLCPEITLARLADIGGEDIGGQRLDQQDRREERVCPARNHGAATRGTVKIFAGTHVYWEVLDKLQVVMPGSGFDATVAATTLDEQFLPWIRFVDVRGFSEPGLAAQLVTDADDRPTAVLVGVLSPAVSLSRDPHRLKRVSLSTTGSHRSSRAQPAERQPPGS